MFSLVVGGRCICDGRGVFIVGGWRRGGILCLFIRKEYGEIFFFLVIRLLGFFFGLNGWMEVVRMASLFFLISINVVEVVF